MPSHPDDASGRDPRVHAIAIFSNYLTDVESGATPDFESLCIKYPEIAGELRKLNDTNPLSNGSKPGGFKESIRVDATNRLLDSLRERSVFASRYTIRNEIGRGAMGVIYRVWDRDLRRHLALKMMREPDANHNSSSKTTESESLRLMRFLDEAQITSQLDHASIVPIHDIGMDERGRVFFTMKLVRGRDLKLIFDLVAKNEENWSIVRAVQVIQKMCEAVAFAHSKGVIHRDLKPSNIMVGQFGEVYVMDFGLARAADHKDIHDLRIRKPQTDPPSVIQSLRKDERDGSSEAPLLTMDGSVLGTPAYMAPEQAMGNLEQLGPASDIYSIGAMLYHLLAGHMPYVPDGAHISQYTLLNLVTLGPPSPLHRENPKAPEELVAICEKAMARDAAQRYSSALEMAEDLEAFLERRPVAARPASFRYALMLAFERNRAVALTAVAAAALLLATGIGFLVSLTFERNKTQRLADLTLASVLRTDAPKLLPLVPAHAGETQSWLTRCKQLLSRRADYEDLQNPAQASPLSPAELIELKSTLPALDSLQSQIRARFARGQNLYKLTIEDASEAWSRAIATISKSPRYRNLNIRPQLGLLPLGENPRSGLYEFWCPLSGERPQLDPVTGKLINQRAGIVMILIPGGEFDMGSPETEAHHKPNEHIIRKTVEPFFMSKFEITQAQWMYQNGSNPSEYAAGTTLNNQPFTELNPVENVIWPEADFFAKQLGLQLPEEAQWEFAARAGQGSAYPWGDHYKYLEGRENVLDANHASQDETPGPWKDPFLYTSPAGSFSENNYGLCDMLGNVTEWCADWFRERYQSTPSESSSSEKFKVVRGGSWVRSPQKLYFRCAYRSHALPISTNKTMGLRVARKLDL
ncbi:MAG: SUMF1/EgtB/PvdO family nonheme iron enzyme [Planctomycetota bacterium]